MSTTEAEKVTHPTFKKLSSPHSESNWTVWDYHMMTSLDGYDLDEKRTSESVLESDKAVASSYISERLDNDNIPLIVNHRGKPCRIYTALRELHQNHSAGGVYLMIREIMNQAVEDVEEMPAHLSKMALLYQRLSALSVDGKISVNDLYVTALISSLAQSWSHVMQPLEIQYKVTPNSVLTCIHSKIVKYRTRDESPSKLVSAPSASQSRRASNTEVSSSVPEKGKNRGSGRRDRSSTSYGRSDYCKKLHAGECFRKKRDGLEKTAADLNRKLKKGAKAAVSHRPNPSDNGDELASEVTRPC
ncbi:hypothetical protein CROQUDRAFT_713255 [Cronartium quercuum f. sp. fusiforme G11]|uniref:Uncharacterized protein n=1 Tax=Cronartium quercuum f. sp. fusiforme G11 TaxID=708437 RepID=A0A9P6NWN2_9BASI|nr:hypothetical protein CROQUDRAFT_713255 [Cronartium quercuum f. sp. fusiforme G11]